MTRPSVTLSTDLFSLQCLLFKYTEDFSQWKNKKGIYCYCRLDYNENNQPYLSIIYIGCTVNFKNIKYYCSQLIRSHQPSHICFYESDGSVDLRELVAELNDFYKPLALTDEALNVNV